MNFLSSKIKVDTFFNTVSFGIIGISGLLINFIIAAFFDATILGIFNLYYAIFIFLSQLVGAGIHFSVLKNVSQHEGNLDDENSILLNGLITTAINALLWLVLIFSIKEVFTYFFTKKEYTDNIVFLLPALFLFVLNKVFLSYWNAKRMMKYYAIINSIRPLAMVSFIVILILLKLDAHLCILSFLVSEFIVFIILFVSTIKTLIKTSISYYWILKHFIHGYKSAVGSVMIDVNTRVDVLMLGYFMNEKMVGIYSMASMIVDGFTQLPIIFRTIINPYITKYYYNSAMIDLKSKMLYGRNLTYKVLIPVGILICIGYPIILVVFGFYERYNASIVPLIILMAGAMLSIGYAPFLMIFNQTGHPGIQSLLYFFIFFVNLSLNFLLIPSLGINGSAIATGISYCSLMVFMKILTHRVLKLSF